MKMKEQKNESKFILIFASVFLGLVFSFLLAFYFEKILESQDNPEGLETEIITTYHMDKYCINIGFDYSDRTDIEPYYFRCVKNKYENHIKVGKEYSEAFSIGELE